MASSTTASMTMSAMAGQMSGMPMAGMPMATSPSGSMMNMSGSMPMVFTTGINVPLFSAAWDPTTTGQYAGTCIFLIVFGVIFRALVAVRTRFFDVLVVLKYGRGAGRAYAPPAEKLAQRRWKASESIMLACVDVVLAGVGYLLMLAVMTYNVGYFLSVLAGIFVGSVMFNHYMSNSSGPIPHLACE